MTRNTLAGKFTSSEGLKTWTSTCNIPTASSTVWLVLAKPITISKVWKPRRVYLLCSALCRDHVPHSAELLHAQCGDHYLHMHNAYSALCGVTSIQCGDHGDHRDHYTHYALRGDHSTVLRILQWQHSRLSTM